MSIAACPGLCWVQHHGEAKTASPPWECSVLWVSEPELPVGWILPCTPQWAQPPLVAPTSFTVSPRGPAGTIQCCVPPSRGCQLHPTDTDRARIISRVIYNAHCSRTGLTAPPVLQLHRMGSVTLCCSPGPWTPTERGGETGMDVSRLHPMCPAGSVPSVAAPAQGWGHLTHRGWLLRQLPSIFQELGEGLHVSGAPIFNHLEPGDRRRTQGDV